MTKLKSLVVWALEIFCEAFGSGWIFLLVLASPKDFPAQAGIAPGDLIRMGALALFGFAMTGYVLTTAVMAAKWREKGRWFYSLVSALLYIIHSEILFWGTGGLKLSERFFVSTCGACLTFACASAGNGLLKRWTNRL